jgi:hypothetical protein
LQSEIWHKSFQPENLAYFSEINANSNADFADYSDGVVRDDFMDAYTIFAIIPA